VACIIYMMDCVRLDTGRAERARADEAFCDFGHVDQKHYGAVETVPNHSTKRWRPRWDEHMHTSIPHCRGSAAPRLDRRKRNCANKIVDARLSRERLRNVYAFPLLGRATKTEGDDVPKCMGYAERRSCCRS